MQIKMIEDVRSELPFLSSYGDVLKSGKIYEASANKHGAVCGKCDNGKLIGVKPGEFVFISLPKWLYDKWAPVFPWSVENAIIEVEEYPMEVIERKMNPCESCPSFKNGYCKDGKREADRVLCIRKIGN